LRVLLRETRERVGGGCRRVIVKLVRERSELLIRVTDG
jgi:hypothetical protein